MSLFPFKRGETRRCFFDDSFGDLPRVRFVAGILLCQGINERNIDFAKPIPSPRVVGLKLLDKCCCRCRVIPHWQIFILRPSFCFNIWMSRPGRWLNDMPVRLGGYLRRSIQPLALANDHGGRNQKTVISPIVCQNNLQKCPISAMQKLHETFPLGLTNNFHGVLYHSRRLRIDWIVGHFVWQAFLKI